jgi:hypothetical protein
MGQGPESRTDVEESPSRVPEWLLSSCLQCVCVVGRSMLSTRAFLLDCFLQAAKLLTTAFSNDGQVPLKQLIMDKPLHIPPDAQHVRPEHGVSLMSKMPCLKRANHFWSVLSALESSP